MFNLTKQERTVLIALAFIFLFGSILHYVFKDHSIREALAIIDSEKIYPKVDLNQASYEDLLRLPGVGPSLAQGIIDYRSKHGHFETIEDIRGIPGIGSNNFPKLAKYFKIKTESR